MIKQQIQIKPIELAIINLKVEAMRGSTLLMNKMSDKERENMLKKVTGKPIDKRVARDLQVECEAKKWFTQDGKLGIPAASFKGAIVEAATVSGISKKNAMSIQVMGDIIPLKYRKVLTNKSITYDSGITKAPRETWRPEIFDWSITLSISYDKSLFTPDQIVELLKKAGFHIGVGSWRPYTKKTGGGNHGMFVISEQ